MQSNPFSNYRHVTLGNPRLGTVTELSGSTGTLLLFDDATLSAYVIGTRRFQRAANLPGASVFTHGDDEGTVHVPLSELDSVAEIVGAKKPRKVSDITKERLRALAQERSTKSKTATNSDTAASR